MSRIGLVRAVHAIAVDREHVVGLVANDDDDARVGKQCLQARRDPLAPRRRQLLEIPAHELAIQMGLCA